MGLDIQRNEVRGRRRDACERLGRIQQGRSSWLQPAWQPGSLCWETVWDESAFRRGRAVGNQWRWERGGLGKGMRWHLFLRWAERQGGRRQAFWVGGIGIAKVLRWKHVWWVVDPAEDSLGGAADAKQVETCWGQLEGAFESEVKLILIYRWCIAIEIFWIGRWHNQNGVREDKWSFQILR